MRGKSRNPHNVIIAPVISEKSYTFLKRGSRGLDMPELSDIDQELDKLGQQA